MTPFDAFVLALVAGSVVFAFITLVGFVRLPDVFARAHAASKAETLGALLGLGAAALAVDDGQATLKVGVLAVFVLVTGPTAAHAIVRAAVRSGVPRGLVTVTQAISRVRLHRPTPRREVRSKMVTEWVVAILLTLVVVAALVAALARGILTTLAAFGAYSLGLSLVWLVFRAPDVALTEAAVGAGVTTALFLVVVARTVGFGTYLDASRNSNSLDNSNNADNPNESGGAGDEDYTGEVDTAETGGNARDSSVPRRLSFGTTVLSGVRNVRGLSVVVAVVVTGGLLLTVPALPVVGATDSPGFGPVTEYYVADSAERGIDNVVTAILVVYRGFDTFGEIAVVFTAVVAAVAVLRYGGTK
ncbi:MULTISPECIES: monovalent cation/H(+) antiporter subunit G [Haloferax]|uniref:monovalent cation/H(+) antiporter subunit G n=1 Tax=Haloferax TaxID=2251 RepID=UPI001CDA0031|nr:MULTISPECIES: monovalent cation/H(+) antiporter subunit G [Haloferax]